MNEETISRAGNALYGFISTVQHNLTERNKLGSQRLMERRAFAPYLPREKFLEFKGYTDSKLSPVLEDIDSWLLKNASETLQDDPNQGLTGVGVYVFDFPKLPYS